MEENQPERGNLRESHVERRAGKEGNHSRVKMLTWMLAAAGLLVTFAPHIALSHDQTINTRLVAPWASTPVLDEAAEFMADVSRSVYWSFVEGLWDRMDHFPPPTSDDMAGDLAAVVAFNLIPSSKLRMMEWALRSRAYSPRVLSLQQLAPDSVPPTCEETFVAVNGKILCDVGELETILKSIRQGGVSDGSKGPVVTDSDHKYPSIIWSQLETNPVPIVVLYGQLTNIQTRTLHNILKTGGHSWGYIFRPYTPKKQMSKDKLVLSGYGIELQFKSQEYKAQDDSNVNSEDTGEVGGFLFNRLNELHPGAGESLEKLQNHLATSKSKKSEFEALKAWQVQELGLQASHFVTLQDDFLGALLDVSGNFPSRAAGLSSVKVPADFKRAVAFNQRLISSQFNLDEGEGAFFLQGSYLDLDSLDLFTFMDNIKVELEFMELLRSLRSDKGDLKKDEVSKILALGTKTSADPELALDLRDSSIFWINDLEKDEEYEDWPDDLTQLFFRMGGIMLRPVRRNVFNLVITLDPSDNTNCAGLLKMVQSFMAHKSPVRIGVVFTVPSEKTEQTEIVRRIFNYAVTEGKTRQVFNDVVQAYSTEDFSKLETRYAEKAGDEYDFGEGLAIEFVRRSGRGAPAAFLNGVPLKWDSVDDFEEVVLNQLLREAQSVQVDAYNGRVNDETDIFEYLMNKPNVQTRLNDKILDVSNSKWLSFGTEVWEPEKRLQNDMAKLAATMSYLIPSGKRKSPVTTTVWIFADTEQEDGRRFLLQALEFLSESAVHSRLSFIPTTKQLSQSGRSLVKSFEAGDAKEAKKVLESWSSSGDMAVNENGLKFMEVLELGESSKGVVVNGRLIGPLGPTETFELGDWSLIEKFSHDSCPKHLIHSGVTDSEDWDADSMMRLCSALSNPSFKKSSKRFTLPDFQRAFTIPADRISSPFDVDLTAVVDPASRHAHKMAAILSAVEETVGQWVRIQVVFNPPSKHSELPLKSYYRYVAGHKSEEEVIFENIPRDPLFTQNIQAPDNWMVEVVKCDKDLDNIRLSDQGSQSVESEYELEYLLVEGHCLETKSGSPPRGLQFTLTPENSNAKASETIVMANLGYFQLKSSPGLWTLDLRDGPSKDIFALETHKNKPVSVNSFQSVVLKVKVKRNPGKESASLLDSEEESQQGWFNFGTNSKNEVKEETINVFSVASGHLYERLLKIMMLSVLKHTKSPVKFWFLKNYLSPTVKDILPKMAKEYGFEYELVQYNWPRWLNPQREKQRIIWGYKILFLDVLFPLSLKKIVFVDADQVVRTDLKELFEFDLEGNPYGYTPFCESRTEMDGFRFWKHGYWKSHLGRRKYHISALYVIDLLRFRKVAAGDRLRGQYQALSQDPNSLSNLDQDLPNNMIHQVGIKSLPQEWLWCETWCDDASKKHAKTIDLCNNPQTKEPKLDAAQRIVPEWKDYDTEIRNFQARVRDQETVEDEKRSKDKHTEL